MSKKLFTFICGDDDYLVSEKGMQWFTEQTQGLSDDFSKEVVDGRAGNFAEVEQVLSLFCSAVQTLPMFGERKVVWLKNVNFMADSVTGRAKGTIDLLDGLKSFLERIDPDSVSVLITAQPVDKRRSFYKWIQTACDFTILESGKDIADVCARLILDTCAQASVKISREGVQALVGKVNGNTRLVVEETMKLCTYAGTEGESIDERLVMELVPNFGDADFFEAADAFFSLNLEWTLDSLRRHFFTNNDARGLLGSLQTRNRLLIQLRVLLDSGAIKIGNRGISKSDLENAALSYSQHFGQATGKSNLNVFTQNPYYLGRLGVTAKKVPLKKLVDFQIAFASAFEAIIKRPKQHESVCCELAVKCLS